MTEKICNAAFSRTNTHSSLPGHVITRAKGTPRTSWLTPGQPNGTMPLMFPLIDLLCPNCRNQVDPAHLKFEFRKEPLPPGWVSPVFCPNPACGLRFRVWIPSKLIEVKQQVDKGMLPTTSVREFLSWFGASRRGGLIVTKIRSALQRLHLITTPDFETPYIDGTITFRPASPVPALSEESQDQPRSPTETSETPASEPPKVSEAPPPVERIEPAHQISRLKSANTPPVWVNPNATVKEAVTIMLANDYSQLPVMQSEREPKGIFSWKSLGTRLSFTQECEYVRQCMDEHKELGPESSLYDAIPLIVRHDCVLIRDDTRSICGIVTPADLSIQFQALAEPFLLVGAIENQLRAWIAARFEKSDLQAAKDPDDTDRGIEDVSDLTSGEYVRLLENQDNWAKLQTPIDRKTFIEKLNKVREIRNDVMHFDPDPMDPSELESLRSFAQFLDKLEMLGAWQCLPRT